MKVVVVWQYLRTIRQLRTEMNLRSVSDEPVLAVDYAYRFAVLRDDNAEVPLLRLRELLRRDKLAYLGVLLLKLLALRALDCGLRHEFAVELHRLVHALPLGLHLLGDDLVHRPVVQRRSGKLVHPHVVLAVVVESARVQLRSSLRLCVLRHVLHHHGVRDGVARHDESRGIRRLRIDIGLDLFREFVLNLDFLRRLINLCVVLNALGLLDLRVKSLLDFGTNSLAPAFGERELHNLSKSAHKSGYWVLRLEKTCHTLILNQLRGKLLSLRQEVLHERLFPLRAVKSVIPAKGVFHVNCDILAFSILGFIPEEATVAQC